MMEGRTARVYYDEPDLRSLDAHVVGITPDGVVLDRTIFYPEGGGQRGDSGMMDDQKVLSTRKVDGDIVHIVGDPGRFQPGQGVHLELDWEPRWRIMQAHTAQHMIAGTLYNAFSIGTVAIHLGDEELTVETDRSDIPVATLYEVERIVNEAILADRKVSYLEMEHDEAAGLALRRPIKVSGPVRLVRIEDVDLIACGGVHVPSTARIGLVTYDSSETIRGHVRTFWRYGRSAWEHIHMQREVLSRLSSMLSAPVPDTPEALSRLLDETRTLKAEVRQRDALVASMMLERGEKVFVSPVELTAYQRLSSPDRRFFTVYDRGGRLDWLLCANDGVFSRLKERFAAFSMKGGGRSPLYQGSAECDVDELVCFMEGLLDG